MSNWYYEKWMEALDKPSPHWHGLPPVVWYVQPDKWPWEPCTALVKEGPKSLMRLPDSVDWHGETLWPQWSKWLRDEK